MQSNAQHDETADISNLRGQTADGLLYTHVRLSANQRRDARTRPSFLYALVELLNERGDHHH